MRLHGDAAKSLARTRELLRSLVGNCRQDDLTPAAALRQAQGAACSSPCTERGGFRRTLRGEMRRVRSTSRLNQAPWAGNTDPLAPELLRRQGGAFRQRAQLRPGDLRGHAPAEAAVRRRDAVLAPAAAGEAHQALG